MLTRSLTRAVTALALTLAPAALAAQAPTGGAPKITIAGAFGGFSGAADLNAAGTAQWELGWAAALDATYWLHRNVGVRASGGWAQDSLRTSGLAGRGRFNKFTYDANVVFRLPVELPSGTLTPYVLGGGGAVTLHQLGSDTDWTIGAGNFGAGLEYRFGQLGVRVEGRDYMYTFDRFGFDKVQHDIAWQGGVTVSF